MRTAATAVSALKASSLNAAFANSSCDITSHVSSSYATATPFADTLNTTPKSSPRATLVPTTASSWRAAAGAGAATGSVASAAGASAAGALEAGASEAGASEAGASVASASVASASVVGAAATAASVAGAAAVGAAVLDPAAGSAEGRARESKTTEKHEDAGVVAPAPAPASVPAPASSGASRSIVSATLKNWIGQSSTPRSSPRLTCSSLTVTGRRPCETLIKSSPSIISKTKSNKACVSHSAPKNRGTPIHLFAPTLVTVNENCAASSGAKAATSGDRSMDMATPTGNCTR